MRAICLAVTLFVSSALAGGWESLAPLPVGRSVGALVIANRVDSHRIYMLGGFRGNGIVDPSGYTGDIERFDVLPDKTLSGPVLAGKLPDNIGWGNGGAIIAGGYIYYLSGDGLKDPTSYVFSAPVNVDGTIGPFKLLSTFTGNSMARRAFVTADPYYPFIYILGADSPTTYESYVAQLGPNGTLLKDFHLLKAPLPRAGMSGAIAGMGDGYLYFAGGVATDTAGSSSVISQVYSSNVDSVTGELNWVSAGANMLEPRQRFGGIPFIDININRLFWIGGCNGKDISTTTNSVEVQFFANGYITPSGYINSLSVAICDVRSVLYSVNAVQNPEIFVLGGTDKSGQAVTNVQSLDLY